MARRRSFRLFVASGLGVALLFAFFVSPLASTSPDGLERVAIDQGFASRAGGHAMAAGPLADYAVAGVENPALSTGLAGVIGVVLCFAVGGLAMVGLRWSRSRVATGRNSKTG